jgi:hypothetical protein
VKVILKSFETEAYIANCQSAGIEPILPFTPELRDLLKQCERVSWYFANKFPVKNKNPDEQRSTPEVNAIRILKVLLENP